MTGQKLVESPQLSNAVVSLLSPFSPVIQIRIELRFAMAVDQFLLAFSLLVWIPVLLQYIEAIDNTKILGYIL